MEYAETGTGRRPAPVYGWHTVEEQRKLAYRHLIYWAMLNIRPLEWLGRRGWRSWSPVYWRRESRRVQCAGAVANWLHNLALYSALNFQRFDEARFWLDFERVRSLFPEFGLEYYRAEFDRYASPPAPGSRDA